jgi:hypothetical protein
MAAATGEIQRGRLPDRDIDLRARKQQQTDDPKVASLRREVEWCVPGIVDRAGARAGSEERFDHSGMTRCHREVERRGAGETAGMVRPEVRRRAARDAVQDLADVAAVRGAVHGGESGGIRLLPV